MKTIRKRMKNFLYSIFVKDHSNEGAEELDEEGFSNFSQEELDRLGQRPIVATLEDIEKIYGSPD